MDRILENEAFDEQTWTLDPAVIERRLLTDLTPSSFEHLTVALLQLEHPEEVWSHVGGSGDGGVDGVGASQDGHVAALLQCKWHYEGGNAFPTEVVWKPGSHPMRRYLAALRYSPGASPTDSAFLDRRTIAQLVAKHHPRLPQALSMRIGVGLGSADSTVPARDL
jgi:hypothetical protein